MFAASLHVGTGPQVIEARPDFILDDVRFETFQAFRLSESELVTPLDPRLLGVSEEMMLDLAAAWWDDFAYLRELRWRQQRPVLVRLAVLSGALTLVIVAWGWWVWHRRRRGMAKAGRA